MNVEAACVFEPLWKSGKIDLLINKQRATDWSAARMLPAMDYLKMQRVRVEICEYARGLLGRYSALVAPSSNTPAGPADTPLVNALTSGATISSKGGSSAFSNVSGLPAISVPCGFTASNLPLGLQFIGAAFDEASILRLAYAYEQSNSWYDRHPRL
jgi:aspartyl-tRNA(Asn)/glutamyl-tRNA(Gln) amidotransferase subunit A